jgi:hypothetical protein
MPYECVGAANARRHRMKPATRILFLAMLAVTVVKMPLGVVGAWLG